MILRFLLPPALIALIAGNAFSNGFSFIRQGDYLFPSELVAKYSNRAIYPGSERLTLVNSDVRFALASFFRDPFASGRSIGFEDYQANLNWISASSRTARKLSYSMFATNHDFMTKLANAGDTLPLNVRKSNYHSDLAFSMFLEAGGYTVRVYGSMELVSPDMSEFTSTIKEGFTVGKSFSHTFYTFADLGFGYFMPDFFKTSQGFNSFFKPSLHGRFYPTLGPNNFNASLVWLVPFDYQGKGISQPSFTHPENAEGFFEWVLGFEFNLPNYGNSLLVFGGGLLEFDEYGLASDPVGLKKLNDPWILGIEMNIRFFGSVL